MKLRHLETIEGELDNHVISFAKSILHKEYKTDEEKLQAKINLADFYCLKEEITDKIFGYESIILACENYKHAESEDDRDGIYNEIVFTFENDFSTPIDRMSPELNKYIENYPDMVKERDEEFAKTFPKGEFFSVTKEGDIKKITPEERSEARYKKYLSDLEIGFSAMDYEVTLSKVLDIALNKGSVEKIKNLLK